MLCVSGAIGVGRWVEQTDEGRGEIVVGEGVISRSGEQGWRQECMTGSPPELRVS